MPIEKLGPSDFQVLEVDSHHAKGRAGNMLYMVWRYETRAIAYNRARAVLADMAREFPTGLGIIQVIETTASPPDAEARVEFSKLFELVETWVKHYSVVHEGTGFKAAAVRAIASGGYFMSGRKFPHEVFSNLNTAADWHATAQQGLGYPRRPEAIVNGIRLLRERLTKIPPPPGA